MQCLDKIIKLYFIPGGGSVKSEVRSPGAGGTGGGEELGGAGGGSAQAGLYCAGGGLSHDSLNEAPPSTYNYYHR